MSQIIIIACTLFLLSVVISSPVPDWHNKKHKHVIIEVPYKIKHVHHYHKVPVYIKEKPIIIKEHHHHHHKEEHHHDHKHDEEHSEDHHHDHKHESNHKEEHNHKHQHEEYEYGSSHGEYHRKLDDRIYGYKLTGAKNRIHSGEHSIHRNTPRLQGHAYSNSYMNTGPLSVAVWGKKFVGKIQD